LNYNISDKVSAMLPFKMRDLSQDERRISWLGKHGIPRNLLSAQRQYMVIQLFSWIHC